MKWTKTFVKNLKVLLRSRGSALMVLIAPLLIVLIIGFSFAGKTENTMQIGIFPNGNYNELSNRFIENLNTSQNTLTVFPNELSCINAIKESVVVTCIVFPQNFALENNKINEVTFYVDESRMNLVYQLISSLTLNVNVESGEISRELTQRMLIIMDETKTTMNSGISSTVSMKAKLKSIEGKSSDVKSKLAGMDVDAETVDLTSSTEGLDNISNTLDEFQSNANAVLNRGYSLINTIGDPNLTSNLKSSLDNLNTTLNKSFATEASLDSTITAISNVADQVDEMSEKLENAQNIKASVSSNIDSIVSDTKTLSNDLDQLKSRQEAILSRINSFSFTSAESISNPITTKIESVVAKNNKITYSFPYLLMLVVLFVGIMLSSTIVFMEKDSRAFFRNFTTPTKNAHFIVMTYLTSLFIIIIQCAVILAAVYFGLKVPLLENFIVTASFLFLGITVFILIGMVVGNLFSTSEAITMSTIAIGSILIFLSNLILPLETLSPTIVKIAGLNPYVIVSESIRKSMLMGTWFDGLYHELIILAIYIIGLLLLVVSLKKISSSKVFEKILRKKTKQIIALPEDHFLNIPEKEIVVKNISELHELLKNMSHTDYHHFTKPKNIFSKWLKESLNEKKLSSKLEGASLEKAIRILDKYLEKR